MGVIKGVVKYFFSLISIQLCTEIVSVTKRKFIFNGVTYNSFADCCHAHSVKPILVERFRRRNKLMRRKALIGYLKYKEKKANAVTFCFANITYHTFTECCNCYGLIVMNKMEVPSSENDPKDIFMPITYKEIYYQSVILC